MTVGESEVHTFLRRIVQFIGRNVIAHQVAAVLRKPQLFGYGMPVETDRVPNPARKYLEAGAVRRHSVNHSMLSIGTADVAGSANRNVEHPVRTKRDELPTMMGLVREPVIDNNRPRWVLELRF